MARKTFYLATLIVVLGMLVAMRWGMTSADPGWDPRYDLDGDGGVDIVDVMLVVNRWGGTC